MRRADRFTWRRRSAPDLPPGGFLTDPSAYAPPPDDGSDVALAIDPASERLQRLPRWPAWDGRDLLEMPVLLKAKGKTTTDQISPAGAWLRFRGHLDRFSDNMFLGAVDAFTGARGEPVAPRARAYRDRGLRWVVIGDWNYGEGSSREHAALSPRLLGGAAIIARSFARIHETNLKKQGLLALTFVDPDDYDAIGPDDRLSLIGLGALAPGRTVTCRLHRPDGRADSIALAHSYSDVQLEWFRAGSALNLWSGAQPPKAATALDATAR